MKREDTIKHADLAIGQMKDANPGITLKELRTIAGKVYSKLIDEVKADPAAVVPGECKKTADKADENDSEKEEESAEDSDSGEKD